MTTLQQGPGLMPRNWLADQLRGAGLNQLADRANSPTSGLGIVADGVGGVVNMLMPGYDSPGQPHPADWTRNLRPGDI